MKQLTHGGLFEGVGGFSLGARNANIETLWAVENNPHKQQVFKQHFPNTQIYGNIKRVSNLPYVDVITGGFPCQDISVSGHGAGLVGERSGLWTEFFRVIYETKPPFVIIENSPQLCNRGLEFILYDLAKLGYNAEWRTLSCEQFGLRHIRKRLFIISYSMQIGRQKRTADIFGELPEIICEKEISEQTNFPILLKRFNRFGDLRTVRANYGFSKTLDAHRIEAAGDAVSPVITEYLFKCIQKAFY